MTQATDGTTAVTRNADEETPVSWRSRVVLPTVVAVCAAVMGLAITGASHDTPALRFVQAGHWIYNSALGKALHMDGGSKNIDAEVEIPGGANTSTVVQTDQRGYVLSRGAIVEFGKSDLAVADPAKAPAAERPVGLEASGGSAFAVYQEAGKVVRFGADTVTESAGGPVDSPVVTDSGTLWVHRTDGGQLCRLPAEASRMTCTATTSAGHAGGLTLVGDRPMWVDTTADTIRPVSKDGLGRAISLGVDLPDRSVIAANDLDGRVAAVDPDSSVVHLVDAAAALDGQVVEPPAAVELEPGEYEQIASTGSTLAVLDETTGEMVTLDATGREVSTAKVPGKSAGEREAERGSEDADRAEDAAPTLFRAADSRLYVDSVTGEHVMVVENGGEITTVPTDGMSDDQTTPTPGPTPSSPSPEKKEQDTRSPERDRQQERDREREQERQRERKPEPPPPSRPGAPTEVRGAGGNGEATVRWKAAPDNGSPITSYVLSWPGGSSQVSGGERAATITGLRNGNGYTVTVSAVNEAGQGPGVSTEELYPGGPAGAPRNFGVTEPSPGSYKFDWERPSLEGGELVEYRLDNGEGSKKTTGTSLTWSDLTDGKKYRVTVRAVTRTRYGQTLTGKPAEVTFTAETGPKIVVTKGDPVDYNDECQADTGCAYTEFEATGLEPNTEYTYTAYNSEHGEYNSVTLVTDENGYEHEDDQFAYEAEGETVWIIAEGPGGPVESNRYAWTAE